MTLRGKHAVVTGGGRGLGADIVEALAAEGADVTVMGRTAASIDAQAMVVTARGAGRAQAIVCDVADAASVARGFAAARTSFGPADVLVNNAGESLAKPMQETTLDDWNRLLGVNLTGAFLCIQQVLPGMLAAGSGRIVNIASTTGVRGYSKAVAYCASKHGVVGLTRALAIDVAKAGITVNALCPGYIEGTPMFETAMDNVTRSTGKPAREVRAMLAKGSPQGSLTSTAEVAEAVLWLCSDEGVAVNGKAIMIPGREVV
jgi:NAD(P)-dependent dehydrogenase (short-subunit alcohol dehydrogenase family)